MALRTSLVAQPHLYMGDTTGRPLDAGKVYFGKPNKDPEFYPINVFYDEALTISAPQPVRTMGGFMNANGQMVEVYAAETTYSVKVLDGYGRQVFYQESMSSASTSASVSTRLNYPDAVERSLSEKMSDSISVKDFGAVGDGVADDTIAFETALAYAGVVKRVGTAGINVVSAAVSVPAGKYKITQALTIPNCVHLVGSGSGSTELVISHAGDGLVTSGSGDYLANIHIKGMTLTTNLLANNAISIQKAVRNSLVYDVVVDGFFNSFYFKDVWTFKVDQCMSLRARNHHVYGDTGTGGLHIYGGRYDVSSNHGVYINSPTAELIISDAAIQSSAKSAVYVADAITTELSQCFLENNCYNSTDDYYVVIKRTEVYTKSSATIDNCVINNTARPDRNGLGIIYVDNIESFTYNERWSRNGVSIRPVITDSVKHVKMTFGTWESRLSSLTHIKPNSESSAIVEQANRPFGVYGADMKTTTGGYFPQNHAAALIGKPESGVALGTYTQKGTIQAYGQSGLLFINPEAGDIAFGQSGLCSVKAGTNTFYGTFRDITQAATSDIRPNPTTGFVAVDTSSGLKTVNLGDIPANYGRRVTIGKITGDSNTLSIWCATGDTIRGAQSYEITTPYQTVTLIGANGIWLVVG